HPLISLAVVLAGVWKSEARSQKRFGGYAGLDHFPIVVEQRRSREPRSNGPPIAPRVQRRSIHRRLSRGRTCQPCASAGRENEIALNPFQRTRVTFHHWLRFRLKSLATYHATGRLEPEGESFMNSAKSARVSFHWNGLASES